MGAGSTFALRGGRGLRVTSRRGLVWITTAGEPDDVWLGHGSTHTLTGDGLTVIEAASDSVIELEARHRSGFARQHWA